MVDSRLGNRVLEALPEAELVRLLPDLSPVAFPQSVLLADVGTPLRHVLFPVTAAVSLVTATADGSSVEAVLIGHEGVVGTWSAVGMADAPWRTVVQAGGTALQMPADAFRQHMLTLPTLGMLVARYNVAAHLLTSQSAACNRFHELTARAARWLLMVSDRTGETELTLTQEFLSQMLGAYRPSVTVALRGLDAAHLIEVRRNRMLILDRPGLERVACECYEIVRAQGRELLRVRPVE
ncbi:MAG: Crp/Fnr family transcriptional regulator [Dehalococcoidia bacterium]